MLQPNLNLSQGERLIGAVRRGRWLWRVRRWQLSGTLCRRCCQLDEERVPSCYIMQLSGQQHIWKASCLPKFAWIGSEQLGEVHNLTLSKFKSGYWRSNKQT
ncbi:TPA: hypothetical protein ACH3X2_012984 [Trebouxia sp. C0005]